MVSLGSLWLPILLSAVLVHLAGFILHAVLGHHWNDYSRLPDEDALMNALRQQGVGAGQFAFPRPPTRAGLKDPAFLEKMKQGPSGLLHMLAPEVGPSPGKLLTHFIYCVVVGVFVAYLAASTLPAGEEYLSVFRVVGTAALLAWSGGVFLHAIWYGWSWGAAWRHAFDGLVYALLTAGVFGWLWPA